MKISIASAKRNPFFYGFALTFIASALILCLRLILPAFVSSQYYQKSLAQLRSQVKAIKSEFTTLINSTKQKQRTLLSSSFPENRNEIFALFQKSNLDEEKEGIAYCNRQGKLILWYGNVIDLKTILQEGKKKKPLMLQETSLLIQDKASIYFVFFQSVNKGHYLAFYRLLAFTPLFKTPYLKQYQFLKPELLRNCIIYYHDFREDVSGFENFFARHEDEYIGQPRLQDEVQTIFFPLRDEKEQIVARVTLSSPSLSARLTDQKENIQLLFYIFFGLSLIFLLLYLLKTSSFNKEKKLLTLFSVILILIGLRTLFLPLSHLEKIQSLAIFSPSASSFISLWGLSKSPADIFLTSLFLFMVILSLQIYSQGRLKIKKKILPLPLTIGTNIVLIAISLCFIFIFQEILSRLVFHSNLNLLRFTFHFSFFLLHLSIIFFFLSFFLAIFLGMRIFAQYSRNLYLTFVVFILEFAAYVYLLRGRYFPLFFGCQAAVIVLIFLFASYPKLSRRKEVLFASFLLGVFFIYASLHLYTTVRNRSLIQHSLHNIIKSQEDWGNFLITQSLTQIETREDAIISFLQNRQQPEFAHSLWERTLIAKFNWYSSLEIWGPQKALLSRFSMNVPILFQLDYELPRSQDWTVLRQNIPFLGRERDFLIAYKDWAAEEKYLGRMTLYLSIDYNMLPFLYSANPYFELLRVSSIPSLNQFDLGFAIFDLDGKLLFNPNKISSGIPSLPLSKINTSSDFLWSTFQDRNKNYKCYYFKYNNRIYSLFLPIKSFLDYSVEFLKLFFFYLVISVFILILLLAFSGKRKFQNPFYSFSNRVYISFFIVAVIPLLLFTFFTRSFFSRIFAQQFREKAEIHANIAQRVMEDYVFFQQREQTFPRLPPENVVLWISSTISNDVNLYQDGRLISSSRREFFDSGLLPELIDGEIYYKIQYENNPFYTQTQKIGDYSFHTLTIPYVLGQSQLLISLPFPLEQQEISVATEELIEFLFFISVFFLALVLFFARGIGGTIVTPIKNLLDGTKKVSLGNLEIAIEHKPKDEMKTLINGFNTMVRNLRTHQQELAEMSKKVAWAEMARKVAHEIKNPLTPIQLSAEHILKVYEDKPEDLDRILKESASYIIKEVENLRKIAQEFLEFSKEIPIHKEQIDLKKIIQQTVDPYKKVLSDRIRFKEVYVGKNFSLKGDESRLKIAIRNILTNAIEAIKNRGEIKINVSKEKRRIRLEIIDTGAGIRRGLLKKIFDPYFSTKDVGTGLGLPIAKSIIESHGGTIRVSSQQNKGTKILITLPS